MESTNKNNNQLVFLCEFRELRKELSTMKKRIVHLEQSHEKQQERIDILERENHSLKKYTELNHLNGKKEGGLVLKGKRTDHHNKKEENESKCKPVSTSASPSTGKKKTKTNNNNDDDETVVIPQHDSGDSFDSLSDDLLHKIVEFDGNCYSKFGLINKRCKNIYDVKEYKLRKQTCVYGYGTVDMMLQHYLQKRKEGTLDFDRKWYIAGAVIQYNRLDAVDWIIQLGDNELLQWVCIKAAVYGRIKVLTNVFLKSNLSMLDHLLDDGILCFNAADNGKLETLKWLRKYGAVWNAFTFAIARRNGYDKIVQYLYTKGCPEPHEDTDEFSVSSDDE